MTKSLSPLDASILALLAQIPKVKAKKGQAVLEETRRKLLERLSPEALEIGLAALAEDGTESEFSPRAQATAFEMKRWARANNSR